MNTIESCSLFLSLLGCEANGGLLLVMLIPLLAAGAVLCTHRYPNIRESISITAALGLCAVIIYLVKQMLQETVEPLTIATLMPGISLTFSIEPLGAVFALVASFLWIVTTIYAIGYMRANKEKHQTRFYACFALALFAAMGVALSDNLFTLFICYEILTLSTYPLVTHSGTDEAKRSGRIYLGILMGTSIAFLLVAVIWVWHLVGDVTFVKGGILEGHTSSIQVALLMFLFMYGVGKAALMPIHRWLPAAMVAPTPVSALLHAVAVVKAGVFTIVKIIIYIFGAEYLRDTISQNWWAGGWLPYVACTTIIVGSIIALRQDNLKKRLAYSTISQLAYVVLAASILVPKSLTAAIFHIAAHAFGKISLFFAAGSLYTALKKKYVSELRGVGRRMPLTMAAFTIGSLSMIGMPLTAGVVSKYFLLLGAFQIEHYVVVLVIIISTLLNAAYFVPIIYDAFWYKPRGRAANAGINEAPVSIVLALMITAIGTILLFIFPQFTLDLATMVVE